MTYMKKYLSIVLLLILFSACNTNNDVIVLDNSVAEESHELATDWFTMQLDLARNSPGYVPPIVSRSFAYTSLAFYESLKGGMSPYNSILGQLNEGIELQISDKRFHWPSVANAAVADMTRYMFDNSPTPYLLKIDELETQYQQMYSTKAEADLIQESIELGKKIALDIYEWSKSDGGHRAYNRLFPGAYIPPEGEGLWVPTNSGRALLPFWGNNRTFISNLNTITSTLGHPDFSTDPESDFYIEALEVYNVSKNLTDEQKLIANYWSDDPLVTYTPPGHSVCILTELLKQQNKSLDFCAYAYLLMGLTQADAFVSCWNVKYTTNLLRPSTYIQQYIDPLWDSFIITPPFPEYTSGHSTQSGASARILTHLFGDNFSFTDSTHSILGWGIPDRTFTSFYEMAEEAGMSRIYGGIHFHSANIHGREHGFDIADLVLSFNLKK